MIEIRAMNVVENKALQKFVQLKAKEFGEDKVGFGVAITDWIIEHIYPELKGKEIYPQVLEQIVEKTRELTDKAAEAQAKELVKNL